MVFKKKKKKDEEIEEERVVEEVGQPEDEEDDLAGVSGAEMEREERARRAAASGKRKLPPLPPLPKTKSDEILELEKKLAEAKLARAKENFIDTAPQRLDDCEKGIEENRNILIQMNEGLKELREQFNLLINRK